MVLVSFTSLVVPTLLPAFPPLLDEFPPLLSVFPPLLPAFPPPPDDPPPAKPPPAKPPPVLPPAVFPVVPLPLGVLPSFASILAAPCAVSSSSISKFSLAYLSPGLTVTFLSAITSLTVFLVLFSTIRSTLDVTLADSEPALYVSSA